MLAADSWGTQADAFTRNCTSGDCSGGAVGGGDSTFAPAVVNYQGAPATNDVGGNLGTATVTATFEPAAPGLATVKQTGVATGAALGIATAQGNALDLVTYNGGPTTVTMTVDLTGTHSGPDSGADNGIDGISGIVRVFLDDNDIASIDQEMSPRLGCLGKCYSPNETVTLEIEDGGPAVNTTIELDLVDGDEVYIQSVLVVTGAGGGVASAPNSLTYSFSPATGLTSLAGGGMGPTDSDGDGIADGVDNCTTVANAAQVDADGDGYGNLCDADLDNNNIVNAADLGLFRQVFFTNDAVADFNSDGVVNASDLAVIRGGFFLPPGPSALAP